MAPELAFPRGSGQRILLVDDEADILEMLGMFLEGSGYAVESFTSSPDALARLESSPEEIDLVLTDLMMPSLGGLQLAERLHDLRPDLPVLLVTGRKRLLEDSGELPPSIRDVLIKPFDLIALARSVAKHLAA